MFFSYWFQAKFGKSLTIYYPFSFYHGLSTTYDKKISSTTFKIKSRLPFSTFHHKTDTGLLIRGPRSFYHRSRIKTAKFVSLMRLYMKAWPRNHWCLNRDPFDSEGVSLCNWIYHHIGTINYIQRRKILRVK